MRPQVWNTYARLFDTTLRANRAVGQAATSGRGGGIALLDYGVEHIEMHATHT